MMLCIGFNTKDSAMDGGQLFYFFLSVMVLAALPGPAMMLTINAAIAHGWRRGITVTAGVLAADTLILAAVCTGIGAVLQASPRVVALMNLAASFYLIYLGAQSLRTARRLRESLPDTGGSTARDGFLVTLINPQTILFLLAYLPRFVQPQAAWPHSAQLTVLSLLFLAAVALVLGVYALAAHRVRHRLASVKTRRAMAVVFGMLLLYLGASGLAA